MNVHVVLEGADVQKAGKEAHQRIRHIFQQWEAGSSACTFVPDERLDFHILTFREGGFIEKIRFWRIENDPKYYVVSYSKSRIL